jgi:hypothetical protein
MAHMCLYRSSWTATPPVGNSVVLKKYNKYLQISLGHHVLVMHYGKYMNYLNRS